MNLFEQLADVIRKVDHGLQFRMLEIGALQVGGQQEPFYDLLNLFPGSQIISFEVDEAVCADMNKKAPAGVRYYPVALGFRNERKAFYETMHPMCCSLYRPNEELLRLYNNFEVAYLKNTTEIDTVSLDYFTEKYEIGAIDFIKIDIQGAELDVFKGGIRALQEILMIVCEVEFIPHYIDQPLFGDVCAFLAQHDLMFHKFLGLAGRALAPIVMNNDANAPSQHIWSDAVYISHVLSIPNLPDEKLLKLSVLSLLYGSGDLSYYCLVQYDKRRGTDLANQFLRSVGR